MDVYLINLDRSPERLRFFQEQACALHLQFDRISAVDGKKLPVEQLEAALADDFEFQPINAGEAGLFMSHKAAWQRLLDSGRPHAAVFEDDVQLSPNLPQVLAAIDSQHPEFDVLKLETTLRKIVSRDAGPLAGTRHTLSRLLSWHGGTAGYVISARCAEQLLAWKEKLSDPIDQVMFNPLSRVSSRLKILQLSPAACIQKDILDAASASVFGTTIDRHVSGGRLFRHGPVIDFSRMLKKQIERQRRLWLSWQSGNVSGVIPFDQSESIRRAA